MSNFFDVAAGALGGVQLNKVEAKQALVGDRLLLGYTSGTPLDGNRKLEVFEFFDTEIPETLPILGGNKQAATHDFIGGLRSVDVYGDLARPIEFTGELRSINDGMLEPQGDRVMPGYKTAMERAEHLDQFYQYGKPVPLRFGAYMWMVVVTQFLPIVHNDNLVEYSIRLEVVKDNDNAFSGFKETRDRWDDVYKAPSATALDRFLKSAASLTKLLAVAKSVTTAMQGMIDTIKENPYDMFWQGARLIAGSDEAVAALSELQTSLEILANYVNVDQAQWYVDHQTAQPYDTLTSASVKSLQADTQEKASQLGAVQATLNKTSDPTVTAVSSSVLAQHIANLTLLGRNLGALVVPDNVPVLNITNPNLYMLASQYYDDPTLWEVIAEANGLKQPVLTGTYTLKIPTEV